MRLQIPPKVTRILDTLAACGYEAYAVGGCIRDTILARTPDDWDITTSARPEEVKALFRRTVDTGLQHGTVTVLFDQDGFEVTTYRIDGEYEDHRHPTEVLYASKLSEDLMRRDFTINAMAYNKDDGLVDLFGGMDDLQKKTIRCVGNPRERFSEDALRILRAVRFSAQLGFKIEAETRQALEELAPTLIHVSEERIQTELVKLLVSKHPEYISVVDEAGILKIILPELGGITHEQQEHLQMLPPEKRLRLAAVLLPLGSDKAAKVLRRLKFDNDTISRVKRLAQWYDTDIEETPVGMRKALDKIGDDLMDDLFVFQEYRKSVDQLRKLKEEVLQKGQCYKMKQLKITGKDLMDMGISPGPKLGEYLKMCLDHVIENPEHNEKSYLQQLVIKEREQEN